MVKMKTEENEKMSKQIEMNKFTTIPNISPFEHFSFFPSISEYQQFLIKYQPIKNPPKVAVEIVTLLTQKLLTYSSITMN